MTVGGFCTTPTPQTEVLQEQRLVVRLLCQLATKPRWCHQRHLDIHGVLRSSVDRRAEGSWETKGRKRRPVSQSYT